MSRRSQSKRMRFNHSQRVRRAAARIRKANARRSGFLGVIHSLTINGKPVVGMGALFVGKGGAA